MTAVKHAALTLVSGAVADDPALEVVSDAAGRMRVKVAWVCSNSRRAVAAEESVGRLPGVRAV
ncbi:hypothetical protein, partial [Mycolicibacter arupensis]